MRVADILKIKGSQVITIRPTDTIQAAAEKLLAEGVGALVAVSGTRALEGIITERDISTGVAKFGRVVHDLTVAKLMTKSVVTCSIEDSVAAVSRIMTVRRMRHLPVAERDQLVGLVSIGDVLKSRLDEMQLETSVLRDIAIASR